MRKIRVLVVEDSVTVRDHLRRALAADPDLDVVGEAGDGAAAIEQCRALRPDVITMDMMLPVMTGLAATEYVMAHFPTPILIVSASFNRGELFRTYDALAAGAVDALDKPTGDEPEGAWERRLIAAVKLVSRIRVITHPRARLRALTASQPAPVVPGPRRPCELIALGASTGGPGAILTVLRGLPAGFAIPILVVLHIGERFASSLAEWLDGQGGLPVRYARDGEPVSAASGHVLLAPPARHLVVAGGRLRLTDGDERNFCRPSVDVLFESVATSHGGGAAAVLLTGMGRDGAEGLLAIQRAGGLTIAQDEATSVVYGMPREAVLLGAASAVLPLPEIAPALAALARRTS